MTAYIASHEKKNRIFAKRERELIHAIKHQLPDKKLLGLAEKMKLAKLSAIKCRFMKNSSKQPYLFSLTETASKDKGLEHWLSVSLEELVESYRRKS